MTRPRCGSLLNWQAFLRQLLPGTSRRMRKLLYVVRSAKNLAEQTISYFKGYLLCGVLF